MSNNMNKIVEKDEEELARDRNNSIRNLKISFALNLIFTIIELVSSQFTNSTAILADAFHDMGDSLILLVSILLTIYSVKSNEQKYSYGYRRFATLGALFNSVVLFSGSMFVLYMSIQRIESPEPVASRLMLVVAVVGIIINLIGFLNLKRGTSLVERSVMLHLLEDILGWCALIIVSISITKTNFYILDPLLSLVIASIIIFNVVRNIRLIFYVFMQAVPRSISINELKQIILTFNEVEAIIEIKAWTVDNELNVCTMKIKATESSEELKARIRNAMRVKNLHDVTIEIELV